MIESDLLLRPSAVEEYLALVAEREALIADGASPAALLDPMPPVWETS